jgi:4-amino-4-deoxy-L-arabinose transferase
MKKVAIIIFVLFFIIYILPLGVRPLLIPDETRYAEIGREIVETGDWIVPRLDGVRYFEKPILGHWLHALSIKLIGANAFAVRLPSALAVALSALILFFLVRRFTGDVVAGVMAASVFLTCLEVFTVGTFCVLDSIFSMFVTASMAAFFLAFMETHPLKRIIFLSGAGFTCGLAFLTKGFLAFVIPAIVFVPFAIWQHQLKGLLRAFWLPVITAVLTTIPWGIMIHLKEPDFWHYFFWVEHIDRFISPNGGQHPCPLWFFVPVIIVGTLPWTIQMIAVIYRLLKNLSNDPLVRFSVCWFMFPFLFFSVCRGKLATYILPCFPPLIVIFVIGLREECKTGAVAGFKQSNWVAVILILILILALIVTQTVIPETKIYRPSEIWKIPFIIIGLLIYVVLLLQAGTSATQSGKFVFSCLAPLMLMFSLQFVIPDKLIEKKAPIDFLSRYKNRIGPNTFLVSDNYLTPVVCWCYKRNDVLLLDKAGEFSYGLQYDDSSKHHMLDINQLQELIMNDTGKKHTILITSTKRYREYKQKLPKPCFEVIECGFVFAEFATGTIIDYITLSVTYVSKEVGLDK